MPKQSNCRLFSVLALLCAIGLLTVAIVPPMPQGDGAPRLTRFHAYKSKVILPPSHGADQQAVVTDPRAMLVILLAAASAPALGMAQHVNPSPKAEFFKMLFSLYKRKANYVSLQAGRLRALASTTVREPHSTWRDLNVRVRDAAATRMD